MSMEWFLLIILSIVSVGFVVVNHLKSDNLIHKYSYNICTIVYVGENDKMQFYRFNDGMKPNKKCVIGFKHGVVHITGDGMSELIIPEDRIVEISGTV